MKRAGKSQGMFKISHDLSISTIISPDKRTTGRPARSSLSIETVALFYDEKERLFQNACHRIDVGIAYAFEGGKAFLSPRYDAEKARISDAAELLLCAGAGV